MSYDIRFAVKVDGHPDLYAVIGEPEYSSPTYNVADILRQSTGWDYKQGEWYKMTDVIPLIEHGIHELSFNPHMYKALEPDNGYGNVGTALQALRSIIGWFTSEWNGLKGSWNSDIPLECIYMSW